MSKKKLETEDLKTYVVGAGPHTNGQPDKPKSSFIKDIRKLNDDFENDAIEPRRMIALRLKLIELFEANNITPDEQLLMERILKLDRRLGTIGDGTPNDYLLNTLESGRCQKSCIVKVDDGPKTHHMVKNTKCKFVKDFDTGKLTVYIPRTVPIEHQISPEIAHKRLNNIPVGMDELPKPRVLIHRRILSPKEFKAWFDVEEGEYDFGKDEKEEVTF